MKRQQQKSAKSVAFLTLPLTEQPRMQSLFIPCFSFFFYQLVSHDYRIKISSASILIFHQQLEECCFFLFLQIYVVRMYVHLYVSAHTKIYVCNIHGLKWSEVGKAHYGFKLAAAYQGPLKQPPTHCKNFAFTFTSTSFGILLFHNRTFILSSVIVSGNVHWEKIWNIVWKYNLWVTGDGSYLLKQF